jgi:hypothetical protein
MPSDTVEKIHFLALAITRHHEASKKAKITVKSLTFHSILPAKQYVRFQLLTFPSLSLLQFFHASADWTG